MKLHKEKVDIMIIDVYIWFLKKYFVTIVICNSLFSLQTFAIPGSIFLSILSGFLFPFYLALLLVCCCSAVGASLCFFLSNILGKKLVKKFFPERAAKWSKAVEKQENNLLNYIIFLRVTPFLPNWFINMSAPVIGVPLVPFALGTFIGELQLLSYCSTIEIEKSATIRNWRGNLKFSTLFLLQWQ